jgi:hypothetical protein
MRTYPFPLLVLALACGPAEPPTEHTPPSPAETETTPQDGADETTGPAEPDPATRLDLPPPETELCCSCGGECVEVIQGECAGPHAWPCDLDSPAECLADCGVCCNCESLKTPKPNCAPARRENCAAAWDGWCVPHWRTGLEACEAACAG